MVRGSRDYWCILPRARVASLALTAEYHILALTGTRTYNAALTGCESK